VVLPLVTFAAVFAMQIVLLLLNVAALLARGQSVPALWSDVQPFRMWGALLYTIVVMALWHAPTYAFLLLASGWARRTAALWAVLPLLALGVLEKLTMDTMHIGTLVRDQLVGGYTEAFTGGIRNGIPFHALAVPTPGRFLGAPGLWIGLALAAVFLAAAVRLRRHREPI
jgi:ABC-2 type transport system permease protein